MTRDVNRAGVQPADRSPRDYYIMVYRDVWEALRGTTALSVYMALRSHINDDGSTWYRKREDLAREAGLGTTAFDNGIKVLQSHGLVEVRHRFVPTDWDYRDESQISFVRDDVHRVQIANLYRLHFHLPTPSRNTGDPSPAKRETPSREPGNRVKPRELNPLDLKDSPLADATGDGPATVAETPVWETLPLIERPALGPETPRSATASSPRSETPVEAPAPVDAPHAPETTPRPGEGRVPDEVTPEFLDWYARYPVSKGRKDGFKAWWKAVRQISIEDLNAATDRYAAWVEAGGVSDKKYVPYPATWLNGERWDDELPDPRPASRPSNSLADWLSPEDLADWETSDPPRTDYSTAPYIDGDL